MKKTTQIAADRAFDEAKTVLPAEVARGVYIENPPGAEALKLMHLLIGKAGGRMAEDVRHELRLADIKKIDGMRNHSRATLRKLLVELAGAVIVFDDTEAQCEIIGGFLDQARLDYRHEISDDLLMAWWFGRAFREMAEKSCHWAIMDRQTVFALSSKYSILLFQHVASLVNLDRVTSKTFTVAELRAVLGVPEGKMGRWNDMNRFALKPAIAEINQLSRMKLTATANKIGRTVASVTIAWEEKPQELAKDAKRELDRPKVGREARREGATEVLVPPFPASGGLSASIPLDAHWRALFEAHVTRIQGGHLPDSRLVCDAFRKSRGGKLDDTTTEKHFVNFCKAWRG
jgi:hypothetical protein